MRPTKQLVFLGLACCLLLTLTVRANQPTGRQSYSEWSHYPERGYYWSTYHFKSAPTAAEYKHHYAIFYPDQPKYVYFYDPVAKVYWGRFDTTVKDDKVFSLLPEKDRKQKVKEIEDKAFGALGPMPVVPGSEDGTKMELIKVESLPKAEK